MKIFNADGRVVKTIHLIPNVTTVVWDTKDKTGKQVPAGVYFCVLDTPQGHYQEKVIINR
jgi:flagellar hook assembly protein FlgD